MNHELKIRANDTMDKEKHIDIGFTSENFNVSMNQYYLLISTE